MSGPAGSTSYQHLDEDSHGLLPGLSYPPIYPISPFMIVDYITSYTWDNSSRSLSWLVTCTYVLAEQLAGDLQLEEALEPPPPLPPPLARWLAPSGFARAIFEP